MFFVCVVCVYSLCAELRRELGQVKKEKARAETQRNLLADRNVVLSRAARETVRFLFIFYISNPISILHTERFSPEIHAKSKETNDTNIGASS